MYAKWRTRLSVAALLAFSAAALMALSAVASADEASNTQLEYWTSHDFTDDYVQQPAPSCMGGHLVSPYEQ